MMTYTIMLGHGSHVSIIKVGRESGKEYIYLLWTERTHGSAHEVQRNTYYFLLNFISPTIGLLSGISLRTVRMGGNKKKTAPGATVDIS